MTTKQNELREIKHTQKLMGNMFTITVVAEDELWAQERISEAVGEIQRIEKLLTTYAPDSETNLINDCAGLEPVKVSMEIFGLIQRSLKISEITDGAFDISYGSLDKRLWNFDKTLTELPDEATAQEMVRLIDYRNIVINEADQTVFLRQKGMRIGFGGIGKGYAAERAKQVMVAGGVTSGIVNASGDLTVWGRQADGKKWAIGIADPDYRDRPFSSLEITDTSIATSGNYEKYAVINGKKYSHTIDPKTGMPITGMKSVTILCPNAEIADALATPVTIMGITAGLQLVDQLAMVECIIIDDDNRIYSSKNINLQ